MKLRISILLGADEAEGNIQIVDATGKTKGFLDADNANAVINVGSDHVIYIGPTTQEGIATGAPATIVSGGGLLDTKAPSAVFENEAQQQVAKIDTAASNELDALKAQLAEAQAKLAAKETGVVGAVDTGLTEVAKIEGEAKVIAQDVAGFFPGASLSGPTP